MTEIRSLAARRASRARPTAMLVILAVLLLTASVMAMALWSLVRPRSPERAATESAAAMAPRGTELPPPPPRQSPAPIAPRPASPPTDDVPKLLAQLRALPEVWDLDRPRAIDAWAECFRALGRSWVRADAETLPALHAAASRLISIVSLQSKGDELDAALRPLLDAATIENPIGATPDVGAIQPMIFAAGLLGRAMDRSDISNPDRRRALAARLDERFGPPRSDADPFTERSISAMRWIAVRLIAERSSALSEDLDESWRRWIGAAQCLARANPDAASATEFALLDIAELLVGARPSVALDVDARRALALIVESIDWHGSLAGRERLLSWLDAKTIGTPELGELLSALPAGALPGAAALQPSASPVERAELRRRLASAWGVAQEREVDLIAERWTDECRRRLAQRPTSNDPAVLLADAAACSLLSATAAALMRDDQATARESLRAFATRTDEASVRDKDAARVGAALTLLTAPGVRPDGEWSARYFGAAGNNDAKLQLVTELMRSPRPLGAADADALAHAAVLGATPEIRAAAQQAGKMQAGSLPMIQALLEQSVQLPRQDGISGLISELTLESLSPVEDARWPSEARAALVARLLELAATGTDANLDRLAELMRESAEQQAEEVGGASESAASSSPADAFRRLRDAWSRRASALVPGAWTTDSLESIERTAAARRALASGPIRAAVAEQASLVEIMAYAVAGERPSRAAACRAVAEEFRAASRRATSVFAQLSDGARAIVRLWGIRLAREVTPENAS